MPLRLQPAPRCQALLSDSIVAFAPQLPFALDTLIPYFLIPEIRIRKRSTSYGENQTEKDRTKTYVHINHPVIVFICIFHTQQRTKFFLHGDTTRFCETNTD